MAVRCASCDAAIEPGSKFCNQCGAAQPSAACPSCGSPAGQGNFCAECGAALHDATSPGQPSLAAPAPVVAERRVTSVLFGDLVAFTTLSESRDAEEVRELLSRYFDECRTVV
jgi:Double zinc ribbon